MIFPWQTKQWQTLWRADASHRLPHALLLSGMAGTGKAIFAQHFVSALLCQARTSQGFACEACHACRMIQAGAHPNVLWIVPEKDGGTIKIDQIREANEFIYQSSLQGDYRVLIIHPADAMNSNAANALLKTLEEPASGAILLLISHQSGRLPATILSRCQRISFARPQEAQALAWLKDKMTTSNIDATLLLHLANGAPLAALQLLESEQLALRQTLFAGLAALSQSQANPLKIATQVQDVEPLSFLDWMLSWVMDWLRLQMGQDKQAIVNQDVATTLAALTSVSLQKATTFMNSLQHLRGQISAGMNVNKLLMIESVLIRWKECVHVTR